MPATPDVLPDKDFLSIALRIMRDMPGPKKIALPSDMAECACGKKVPAFSLPKVWTGYFYVFDNVCKECRKEMQKMAAVACVKCRTVAFRMEPHRTKDGFVFGANRWYHIDHCACDIDAGESTIIELAVFRGTKKPDKNHATDKKN